ncbi:hypothetical protein [Apilactobacillus timberlakei]|uniref:ABC transporter permease n=1 Tax=Apilactobacillus timberlakei TaxID=2008380 RepID=A0ABY2YWJ5_9LACO|nr:hypothetical protein [Apilactobacillus timberlakei]TPR14803.1 hypothetical protein DYZ97_01315 [Apilactobacillus timberlakei]TPR16131.1 hypothetical protein DY048_01315 [Apilactobacillus timberlakei]
MSDLLKQEMNSHNRKIFSFMALGLFIVTIIMAITGMETKTLDGWKWMNQFGAVTGVIELLTTIIVATRFAGQESNAQVKENMKNHSKSSIFFSKVITILISYLILLLVAIIAVILMKYLVFPHKPLAGTLAQELSWAVLGNIAYFFIFQSFIMMIIGFCKTWYGAIAFGVACTWITEIIAGIFMIFIYTHRKLIYNPFNFFFVEKQIQDGMKHMMTRLQLPMIIKGSLLYALIFFIIAFIIFVHFRKFNTWNDDEEKNNQDTKEA